MTAIIHINKRKNGKNFAQASLQAADWIMRFGYSTKDILENHLFHPGQAQGLCRDLFARGWATEIDCHLEGSRYIIVLTKAGYNAVRDEYDPSVEYPELDLKYCDFSRCQDLLLLQKATADNMRVGTIEQFWTPRMIRFQSGYPSPGVEWLMKDGDLISVDADTGCDYPWRHELCVNLAIRMGEENPRYERAALFATEYEIVQDYHTRLAAGNILQIWDPADPTEVVPIGEIAVPDMKTKLVVYLTDLDQDIVI